MGADIYLAQRASNPPIYGAKRIPKKMHYSGEWTPDILIVAHPGRMKVRQRLSLSWPKVKARTISPDSNCGVFLGADEISRDLISCIALLHGCQIELVW